MERRTSDTVATIYQRDVDVQKLAHARDVVQLRGFMDGMLPAGYDTTTAFPSLREQLHDRIVAALPSHFDQTAVVVPIPLRVCACIEKHPHRFRMP
jgi:hypothetical protein